MTKAQKKAARSFRSAVKSAKRSEQRFFDNTENAWTFRRDEFRMDPALKAWLKNAAAYRSEARF